ncbi:MAG: signal peptidase II [Nitrospinae bacterium]|nr:signal peptidase II [Nitrospinota bacterium]
MDQKMVSRFGGPVFAIAMAAILVVMDLVTKLYIENNFSHGTVRQVIPGLFNIVYVKNKGAAFGMLGHVEGDWVSYAFTTIAIIAIVVIIVLYRTLPADDTVSRIGFTLVGAGALGNLIDRFRTGSVTDFLLVYIGQYQWPAFNVADSCITIGVILLAFQMLMKRENAAVDGAGES